MMILDLASFQTWPASENAKQLAAPSPGNVAAATAAAAAGPPPTPMPPSAGYSQNEQRMMMMAAANAAAMANHQKENKFTAGLG